MKEQILRECINEAFKDTSYPGDDYIVRKGTYNIPGIRTEEDDIRDFFLGRKWKEITLEYLSSSMHRYCLELPFLVPEAMCYYLPSFLLICTYDDEEEVSAHLSERLLFSLENPEKEAWYTSGCLTYEQCHAVYNFLKYKQQFWEDQEVSTDEFDRAFHNYWGQYSDPVSC